MIYCFIDQQKKKSAQKIWSKDLVHKKTFLLLNRTPQAFKIYLELLYITLILLIFYIKKNQLNEMKEKRTKISEFCF